jgi:hypothetical protein
VKAWTGATSRQKQLSNVHYWRKADVLMGDFLADVMASDLIESQAAKLR